MADIMKLRHSRFCYENNLRVRIGNELRLYYATQSDDFIYVDADSLVENIQDLKMNMTCRSPYGFNEGSYFRANKDTDWCRFYVNVYETDLEIGDNPTATVYKKYPFTVPLQDLNYTHFYVSIFNRFPKVDKILYTDDYNKANESRQPVWCFDVRPGFITNGRIFHTTHKLPFEVFKEQLMYSQQNSNLKFEEI